MDYGVNQIYMFLWRNSFEIIYKLADAPNVYVAVIV